MSAASSVKNEETKSQGMQKRALHKNDLFAPELNSTITYGCTLTVYTAIIDLALPFAKAVFDFSLYMCV